LSRATAARRCGPHRPSGSCTAPPSPPTRCSSTRIKREAVRFGYGLARTTSLAETPSVGDGERDHRIDLRPPLVVEPEDCSVWLGEVSGDPAPRPKPGSSRGGPFRTQTLTQRRHRRRCSAHWRFTLFGSKRNASARTHAIGTAAKPDRDIGPAAPRIAALNGPSRPAGRNSPNPRTCRARLRFRQSAKDEAITIA
jgi:hypothetical protein